MAHQFSMLSIFNAALISQGYEEIASEEDGTDEFRLLSRNWPGIVEAELEDGLYDFTRQETTLLARSDGLFGFSDAYTVPLDALHIRQLWIREPRVETDWVQDSTRVHVKASDGVIVEYVAVSDPSFWGANFSRGVQMKLEAVLLRFKEEYASAERMEMQAEMYFSRARAKASKSRSATDPYKAGRIVSSRFTKRNG